MIITLLLSISVQTMSIQIHAKHCSFANATAFGPIHAQTCVGGNRASSRVKCQMYRLKNAAAASTLNKSGARLRQLFQFMPIWNAYRKGGRRNKLQAINRVKILPLSVTVCIVREPNVEA